MLKIQSFVESLDTIKRTTPDEALGSILGMSSSSHDPIFIFDKHNTFLGLVSPYLALYQRRLPYTAKAATVRVMPPVITVDTDLLTVVGHMLSTRLYTLPVFDTHKQMIGMVRAVRIFQYIIASKELLDEVSQQLVVKRPHLIRNDVLVKDAYQQLRQENTSRLLVVDADKKLIGILTRNDLKRVFIAPSPRQRFSKSSGNVGQGMFDEEELKRSDLSIKKFIKTNVFTGSETTPIAEAIKKLARSKRNSIVLINTFLRPAGLISYRDILLAISKLGNVQEIPIVMEKPQYVNQSIVSQISHMLTDMAAKINMIMPVKRIEISFKEGRNEVGKPTLTQSTLKALFYTRDSFVATVSNRNILISVHEALHKITNMVRRASDKNKHKH